MDGVRSAKRFAGGAEATESTLALCEADETHQVPGFGIETPFLPRARSFKPLLVIFRVQFKARPSSPGLDGPVRE